MDLLNVIYEDEPIDDDMYSIRHRGWLRFFVIQNSLSYELPLWRRLLGQKGKVTRTFEVEVDDWSGCVDWMQEGVGVEYWIKEFLDLDTLHEGVTYEIDGLSVAFIRGDGWWTDDDEEWEWDVLISRWSLLPWLSHKIEMIFHRQVRCRFFRKEA